LSRQAVSNLTWIWNPAGPAAGAYYPGPYWVDWIGLNCGSLNGSFDTFYGNFSADTFQKPVMLLDLALSGPATATALIGSAKNHKAVRGILFTGTERLPDPAVLETLRKQPFSNRAFISSPFGFLKSDAPGRSGCISGERGNFRFTESDFYIRGIAYNPGHDWRDGNIPLTRRQLEKDFTLIRQMGANTIRRYGSSIYDRNVLNLAQEHGLKVLFGFFFDPAVDYYRDSAKIEAYISEVESSVKHYRGHPAVLGWVLGNETWGQLKKKFGKPYLVKVRQHYVKMIELLAQRIHRLDPSHPVLTGMEHIGHQLPGELWAFRTGAPSVDIIAINSYYRQNVSRMEELIAKLDPSRPYIVSEFGPKGYWEAELNTVSNGLLAEETETEKSEWYREQWEEYVLKHKGSNLGGVAYCWRDRLEGSLTWFGLMDHKGRLKPSYFSLKQCWTGDHTPQPAVTRIQHPHEIVPGREYDFTAVSAPESGDLRYEWSLYRNDYLEEINNIRLQDESSHVKVTIPEAPGRYRLYLHASAPDGKVFTCSVAMEVK